MRGHALPLSSYLAPRLFPACVEEDCRNVPRRRRLGARGSEVRFQNRGGRRLRSAVISDIPPASTLVREQPPSHCPAAPAEAHFPGCRAKLVLESASRCLRPSLAL